MGNQSSLSPALIIIAYILITLHTGCKVDEKTAILGEFCPSTLLIVYHGQSYNTVQIGNQCWLKENLNYDTGHSWCDHILVVINTYRHSIGLDTHH
ncbi:MAG: hypothetical protein NT175_12745 [Bacteroidetes bacterium]|nr:hypothetical protein [Bacteroidota bacterium]